MPSRKGHQLRKASIEKLQNEHQWSGHEESIQNMFFCIELCLLFSAGQQRITKLINSMRMRCQRQAVVQALGSSTCMILSPDHVIEIIEY